MARFDYQGAINSGAPVSEVNSYLSQHPELQVINGPQPQVQSSAPQDNSNPLANGLNSIISSIVKPIIDYVQEAGKKEQNATPTQKLTQAIKQSFNPLAGIINDPQGNFDPQGAKAAADAASFVVPFGEAPQGAGILSKILAKAVPGAAVGGLSGFAQPNATPLSVENSALTGGIAAPLLSGILGLPGALGGKLGNAAENVGEDLQNSVTNIKMPAAVGGAQREAQISQTLRDLVPGNTAAAKYEALQPTMSKLGDGIQAIIDNNSTKVPTSRVVDELKANMTDTIASNNLDPQQVDTSIQNYINKVLGFGTKDSPVPESLTQNEINKLRLSANNDFSKIAKKFIPGSPQTISPNDYVVDTARQTFKDLLTQNNPEAAGLISQQHDLFDAAKSLAKSRNTPSVFTIPGTRIGVPNTIDQTLASGVGKATEGLGGILNSVSNGASSVGANPLLQSLLTRGAVGAVNNVQNPTQNPNNGVTNNDNTNNTQNQVNQNDQTITPNVNQSQTPGQITPEMVAMAYRVFPAVRADRIKKAYDAQQIAQGPKLIQSIIDQTTPLLDKSTRLGAGGYELQKASQDSILGKLGIISPDPATTQLDANLAALKGQVVLEFTKRGLSSPQAINQLDDLIPKASQSKSAIKQKLTALPKSLEELFRQYGVATPANGGQ